MIDVIESKKRIFDSIMQVDHAPEIKMSKYFKTNEPESPSELIDLKTIKAQNKFP